MLTSTGNVTVRATAEGDIDALAIGLAGAASGGLIAGIGLAGAGSGAVNYVANVVEALVVDSDLSFNSDLAVYAKDDLDIDADAGAGALAVGSGGLAGVGIAVGISAAANVTAWTTRAAIDGSTVTGADNVIVDAQSQSDLTAITGAGAFAASQRPGGRGVRGGRFGFG